MTERDGWYEFRDGRRLVVPYLHSFSSFAKGRWVGRRVLSVLADEMHWSPPELQAAVSEGRLTINGFTCRDDTCFRHGDKLVHQVLRTEPSVPAARLELLSESSDLLVINKPAGVPVHHAGRFRRNSLVEILQHERPELGLSEPEGEVEGRVAGGEAETGGGSGDAERVGRRGVVEAARHRGGRRARGGLHVAHRLDRQVSGVLLLPRTAQAASELAFAFESGGVIKWYLARVRGCVAVGVTLTARAPILVTSAHGATSCACAEGGKAALTRVRSLGYDESSDTSLVLAEPWSGRPHQVRLHLAHLGHPIVNDSIYGGEEGGRRSCDTLTRKRGRGGGGVLEDDPGVHGSKEGGEEELGHTSSPSRGGGSHSTHTAEENEDEMWLHAWRYHCTTPTRSFHVTAPPPQWAQVFGPFTSPHDFSDDPALLSSELG